MIQKQALHKRSGIVLEHYRTDQLMRDSQDSEKVPLYLQKEMLDN